MMVVGVGSALDRVVFLMTLPLRVLYFHGPRLGGYGFHEGIGMEHACEQATSVRSEFWTGSNDALKECEGILQRKFNAFVVGWCALIIIGSVYTYVSIVSTRCALSVTVKKLDEVLAYMKHGAEKNSSTR